ncbi:MAG TPA: hypothetical protein VKS60_05475 [Stellaceae bacterium]|nr:hypothetical protein [Stellaceae bacterium]
MDELSPTLVQALAAIPGFWGPDKSPSDVGFMPDFDSEEFAVLDLRSALAPGLSGLLYYRMFAGDSIDLYADDPDELGDDVLELDVDNTVVNYRTFCREIFPEVVRIFGAYRGAVKSDREVQIRDGDSVMERYRETGLDVNRRSGIFRIWPVSYFGDELCRRSFRIGAAEVVKRAAPICELAEVRNDGAFLIATSDIVTGKDLDRLSVRIASRITPWRGFLYRLMHLGSS